MPARQQLQKQGIGAAKERERIARHGMQLELEALRVPARILGQDHAGDAADARHKRFRNECKICTTTRESIVVQSVEQ